MAGLPVRNEEKTEFLPVPSEVYDIRLLDIEPKEGQYGPYWSWKFEITEYPNTGRWLWISSHNNVNPKYTGGKSLSPRVLASTLLGREIGPDEYLDGKDYLDLIGLPARGAVGIQPGRDGKPRNVLNTVLPARKDQIGGPAPKVEMDLDGTQHAADQAALEDRYMVLKNSLGWTKDMALEMIENWTERRARFHELTLTQQKLVIKWMEALDRETDPPFNAGGDAAMPAQAGDKEEDNAPELTAAGLVSPTTSMSGGGKAGKTSK